MDGPCQLCNINPAGAIRSELKGSRSPVNRRFASGRARQTKPTDVKIVGKVSIVSQVASPYRQIETVGKGHAQIGAENSRCRSRERGNRSPVHVG